MNKWIIIMLTFMVFIISFMIPEYWFSWFPLENIGFKLVDVTLIIFMLTTVYMMLKK